MILRTMFMMYALGGQRSLRGDIHAHPFVPLVLPCLPAIHHQGVVNRHAIRSIKVEPPKPAHPLPLHVYRCVGWQVGLIFSLPWLMEE